MLHDTIALRYYCTTILDKLIMPFVNSETPRHVGSLLLSGFMQPLGLSAYRVAKDAGISQITLSQIVRGTRRLSPAVALKLGAYFGTGPLFWCEVQAVCDLRKAESQEQADAPPFCQAMSKFEVLVERVSEPDHCWRSRSWRVRLERCARKRQSWQEMSAHRPERQPKKKLKAVKHSLTCPAANGAKTNTCDTRASGAQNTLKGRAARRPPND